MPKFNSNTINNGVDNQSLMLPDQLKKLSLQDK